jgi:hypothetical protein
VRAGLHADCPSTFLDRCLFQVELTLNILHPYEYDPRISAHHGIFGYRFDFKRHPIAPVGAKVLTWDSTDHRGSWADHGVEVIYLGPAIRHFRGFEVWVPQTASKRVTGTVWWFLKPVEPDNESLFPDMFCNTAFVTIATSMGETFECIDYPIDRGVFLVYDVFVQLVRCLFVSSFTLLLELVCPTLTWISDR